ncbi:sensor domain-containing diguanylate cyclase [Quisquiliibacterium transsilvanicum]|uniref:diguanylate cyclase n=1 Tax=Quisquiliibacterium transsilvanicum TaxID=1549638 RepID=A0A7W8HGC6_9BURK|nr:GGDEF domain-containing protein [Quisquiliibacterium transsilvanicum]MBB5270690.1 diguanylate cyclase (GGDEF)-like protein [Quisquiliibacterium transsilvanicum]
MMAAPDKAHWVVRMNYRNRTFSGLLLFATLGAHLVDRGAGAAVWAALALYFLVFPHVVHALGRRAPRPLEFELRTMLIEAVLFGIWVAGLGFPAWIGFIMIVGVILNLVVFRGLPAFFAGAGAVSLGLLAGWAALRTPVATETGALTTALSMATLFLYVMAVGRDSYTRAMRLHRAHDEVRASEQALGQRLDEIEVLQAQLKDQAERDPLTGLYNRRYLSDAMGRELARMAREGKPLSVMLIDIDHFKAINDSHGHPAGDACLVRLGGLLRENIRESDIVCRWGGEEFLIALPTMSSRTAGERAEWYRAAFERQVAPWGDALPRPTLSIGIAGFPEDGRTAEELVAAADARLYRAKTLGRNRVEGAGDGASKLTAA